MNTLVVCTGNICRSPMAVGLLRHRFADRGIDGRVLSAGLVTEGQEASPNSVEAMARRGIDISDHRSQRLSPSLVTGAGLIVGMERQHVREVAVLDPDAFAVTFTLPELARRARDAGPRPASDQPQEWVRRLGADRRPDTLLGENRDDEVADPYGRSARRYEATAVEIEGLIDIVLDHLYPLTP